MKTLLEDKHVEDILLSVNGLSYFKNGSWNGPKDDIFCNEKNLFILSRKIADRANITLGLTQPSADSYIDLNGEHLFRAHVVVTPMCLNGIEITLRRIAQAKSYSLNDFNLDKTIQDKLVYAIKTKKSILIAGATGAGKSSLISALMQEIPLNERVLILEDSPELPIPNKVSTKLIARTDKFGFREGANWDLKQLVYESLRMRPDRIIIGECRGPEAQAISQALMTGHKGIMTTLHAGSCQEALERFDKLVQGNQSQQTFQSEKHWDQIIHVSLDHNSRRLVSVMDLSS